MAVNESRNMSREFVQGAIDNTYMTVAPDRGGVVEQTNSDRMSWPTYKHAEQHAVYPKVLG